MLLEFIQLLIMEIEVDFQIMQTLKILREDMYQAVNPVIARSKKSIYWYYLTLDPLLL